MIPEDATVETVKTALREHIEAVVHEVALSLIYLGSEPEWSMEDNFNTTEGIAGLADRVGLPSAGDQSDEELAFWRTIREAAGL